MERGKNFNWSYLIIGILYILISLMSFRNPEGSLIAVVMMFGMTAVAKGIFELLIRNKMKEYTGYKSKILIVLGILDIVVGVLLIFNIGVSLSLLPYFFAVWFIMDSVGELSVAKVIKLVSRPFYWFTVAANVLGIILGFVLMFNPLLSAFTLAFLVGFYFMITGINYVVAAF
ncbi:HdeD family acid-resistance protein [Vagococcus elongatus]|uniref:DUF308 domain-containing protein n=1 Tax=Vagococcus elongatus TaxID=180344 RepID=A0A430AUX3_9ENTE|nr:DUF308 domain-containing protein [Vagococcus elongatus]RSU11857.1 hypothetical protein CBF29_06985 [Vagococcus elongatus]